jgi:hypothetical protein
MRRHEGGKACVADRDRALVDDRGLRVARAVEPQQAARHEGVIADIMRGGTTVTITRTAACPAFTTTVGPVTYTISDGLGGSATGTITPVITCENISN